MKKVQKATAIAAGIAAVLITGISVALTAIAIWANKPRGVRITLQGDE